MTIEQTANKVIEMARKSNELAKAYKQKREKYDDEVKNDMRGMKQAKEELDNDYNVMHSNLVKDKKVIYEMIDKVKDEEINRIKETSLAVTADQVAEIELLGKLKLQHGELNEYLEKYKHTPLALRRLKNIADEQAITHNDVMDREQYLGTMLSRWRSNADSFSIPDYNRLETILDMVTEGTIESIKNDVETYKTL